MDTCLDGLSHCVLLSTDVRPWEERRQTLGDVSVDGVDDDSDSGGRHFRDVGMGG